MTTFNNIIRFDHHVYVIWPYVSFLFCYLNFDSDAEHDSSLSISIHLPYTFNETNSNWGM